MVLGDDDPNGLLSLGLRKHLIQVSGCWGHSGLGLKICNWLETQPRPQVAKRCMLRNNRSPFECPRLLFPFARNIMAESTRDGGFPPLLIQPVDFAAMFRQSAANQAAAASSGPAAVVPPED